MTKQEFEAKKLVRISKKENAISSTIGRMDKAKEYKPVTVQETDWHNANLNRLGLTLESQKAELALIQADFYIPVLSQNPEIQAMKAAEKAAFEALKAMKEKRKAFAATL